MDQRTTESVARQLTSIAHVLRTDSGCGDA
jgi:hypothetical protein